MSAGRRPLRLLCFADRAGEVWGAALDVGQAALLLVTPEGTLTATGDQARLSEERDGWRVRGDGFDLEVSADDAHQRSDAGDALGRLRGTVRADGGARELDCSATISSEDGALAGQPDSIRALTSWLDDDHALSLRSVRSAGRSDQERDLLAATLFDPEDTITVAEPRLSTTFSERREPLRASLELWIGDQEEQYPRRAAAEARGDSAAVTSGPLTLQLTPMRCHAGGLDGPGVYLLAQF